MHNAQELGRKASGLLSAEDVESLLGVDKSTVYRMAADGRLSAIKIGRQWRFPAGPLHEMFTAVGVSPHPATPSNPDLHFGSASAIIEPVLDLSAHLLGVMMVATDMEGTPFTNVVNPCPWFSARQDDPEVLAQCIDDWRGLAQGVDFEPHLTMGSHGFECARVFIREGSRLVGMVLAGGVVPEGSEIPGLYTLDSEARNRLLASLPRTSVAISHILAQTPSPTRSAS